MVAVDDILSKSFDKWIACTHDTYAYPIANN
jgi:hypothetical protein